MLLWSLLAQSAAVSGPVLKPPPLLNATQDCQPSTDEEVVICARPDEPSPYRLKPLPERFERPLIPKAEASVLGGSGSVEGEQADVGGTPSRRVMARMKWKF